MRIVIATPLYPPDIAEPAPYVKELAGRLAKTHTVTVVAFGEIPEEVPGVTFVMVSKRQPLLLRLVKYLVVLLKVAHGADLVFVENGSSTELTAGIAARMLPTPFLFHIGDTTAHAHTESTQLRKQIEHFFKRKARTTIAEVPLQKPEILPFREQPTDALRAYETSWGTHLHMLEHAFNHV